MSEQMVNALAWKASRVADARFESENASSQIAPPVRGHVVFIRRRIASTPSIGPIAIAARVTGQPTAATASGVS